MSTLQYFDIKDSKVQVVNEEKSPEKRLGNLEDENATLWFENMTLDAKLDEETSALWFEIMMGEMRNE